MKRGVRAFFKYARERHQIFLNKDAGQPRPWTKDLILQQYRFTNVFRELDKTTVWYRKNVRERYENTDMILLATVVFRMLNRIDVGEAIFNQRDIEAPNAFELFARKGATSHIKRAITALLPRGPYVTGAYIISSPPGMSKLDGVLNVIERFYHGAASVPGSNTQDWRSMTELLRHDTELHVGLECAFEWLKQFDYFGKFHSYEIVTDLRHTSLLNNARDIMTWANPGPGARRGANRVMGRAYDDKSVSREGLIREMREILEYSRFDELWSQSQTDKVHWPMWEMRDVEHTLCEFDKYERVRTGQGRPRGVYK